MSDGSRATPMVTAGLDLGDKYSYLCLLDTDSGKVLEEGRLPTTPEALSPTAPLRITSAKQLRFLGTLQRSLIVFATP